VSPSGAALPPKPIIVVCLNNTFWDKWYVLGKKKMRWEDEKDELEQVVGSSCKAFKKKVKKAPLELRGGAGSASGAKKGLSASAKKQRGSASGGRGRHLTVPSSRRSAAKSSGSASGKRRRVRA